MKPHSSMFEKESNQKEYKRMRWRSGKLVAVMALLQLQCAKELAPIAAIHCYL